MCSLWIIKLVTWIRQFITTYTVFAPYVTLLPFTLLESFHPPIYYLSLTTVIIYSLISPHRSCTNFNHSKRQLLAVYYFTPSLHWLNKTTTQTSPLPTNHLPYKIQIILKLMKSSITTLHNSITRSLNTFLLDISITPTLHVLVLSYYQPHTIGTHYNEVYLPPLTNSYYLIYYLLQTSP